MACLLHEIRTSSKKVFADATRKIQNSLVILAPWAVRNVGNVSWMLQMSRYFYLQGVACEPGDG